MKWREEEMKKYWDLWHKNREEIGEQEKNGRDGEKASTELVKKKK